MEFAVSGVCRKKEGKSLRHEKNCVLHGYGVVVVGLFFLSVGRLADTAFNGDAGLPSRGVSSTNTVLSAAMAS